MGPEHVIASVEHLRRMLPAADRREMGTAIGGHMPGWMTAAVSEIAIS